LQAEAMADASTASATARTRQRVKDTADMIFNRLRG